MSNIINLEYKKTPAVVAVKLLLDALSTKPISKSENKKHEDTPEINKAVK